MVLATTKNIAIIITLSAVFFVFSSNLITSTEHFAQAKLNKKDIDKIIENIRERFRDNDDDKKDDDKEKDDDNKEKDDDDEQEVKANYDYSFADEDDTKRKDFNFVAAGDFGCSKNTKKTISNMEDKKPELVLPLGDLSYDKTATCWLDLISPFNDRLKVTLGHHDVNDGGSKLNQYKEAFGLDDKFYGSFDYKYVHFITMATESKFDKGSEQYKFIAEDLKKASENEDIDWIIVTSYGPFYTSPSTHKAEKEIRDLYHPLFEKYGVDLVLHAHNHNYQRTYPLAFNPNDSSKPIVTNEFTTGYNSHTDGTIFAIIGTGGESFYTLEGREPYMATQFGGKFGFLDIEISNGNPHTKLTGTFYDNKGSDATDHFTIEKEIKNKK
ncbi:MAG TPA: metallophosphoesterase [Nitrososphaeraceae archaeon]|nr:metallophosphoesterase [Nitrososphaeraceae archaeon]